MKKMIVIKICLSLCMFIGINYTTTNGWQAGNRAYAGAPCNDHYEYFPEFDLALWCVCMGDVVVCSITELAEAVCIGHKPDGGGGGSGGSGGTGGTGDTGDTGTPPGSGGPTNPPPPDPPVTYNVTVLATQGGSAGGGGTFTQGASCNISASPAASYVFYNWTGGGVSSAANPYSFTVTGSCTITAHFMSKDTLCAALAALLANDPAGFKNRIDNLAPHLSDPNEWGYYQRPGETPVIKEGTPKYWPFKPSGSYTEIVHIHINECPFFSGGDIKMLFRMLNGGNINAETFRYGLLVGSNYYFLHITDINAFTNFCNNHTAKKIDEAIQALPMSTANVFVAKMINFLKSKNAGLTMIMGYPNPNNTAIDWQVKDADANDALININCPQNNP